MLVLMIQTLLSSLLFICFPNSIVVESFSVSEAKVRVGGVGWKCAFYDWVFMEYIQVSLNSCGVVPFGLGVLLLFLNSMIPSFVPAVIVFSRGVGVFAVSRVQSDPGVLGSCSLIRSS